MNDDESLVHLLIGTAIAKRFKQLSGIRDETAWFAVALAAQQVLDCAMRDDAKDPLDALDEWFELEAMIEAT